MHHYKFVGANEQLEKEREEQKAAAGDACCAGEVRLSHSHLPTSNAESLPLASD